MSWLSELEDELAVRRVPRRARERLVAELADHLACEQGWATRLELTRLGAAREIAGQYADELATSDARRGAFAAFGALALTAAMLLVTLSTLGGIGYPGLGGGFSAALSLPAIAAFVFGSQVAWVAGMLAAWRAARRRAVDVMPGAEVALVRSRTRVAIGAGLAISLGAALYVIDFIDVMPLWWLVLAGGLSALATAALVAAWRTASVGSRTVALADGPAGDMFDDIPLLRPLRGHPLRTCLGFALASGTAITLVEWHAERSFAEGLQRGGAEAIVFVLCFALLGRAVGARR